MVFILQINKIIIIFDESFGGAYDIMKILTSASIGDCQAPHKQSKVGAGCLMYGIRRHF